MSVEYPGMKLPQFKLYSRPRHDLQIDIPLLAGSQPFDVDMGDHPKLERRFLVGGFDHPSIRRLFSGDLIDSLAGLNPKRQIVVEGAGSHLVFYFEKGEWDYARELRPEELRPFIEDGTALSKLVHERSKGL